MNNFSFNTAIARLMEFVTAIYKYDGIEGRKDELLRKTTDTLILLLAPCAPHFAEELWSQRGNKKSVFTEDYPVCDENALVKDEIELAVQLNSKVKAKINVSKDATEEEIKAIALANETIAKMVDGKEIVKAVVVKGRLVNFIVKG